ncbi:hypothetical protein AHAS_Ahas11G0314000 [Arachis hypogaea]
MVNPDDPDPVLRLPLSPSPTFQLSTMCALLNHDIYGPSMRIPCDKGGATTLHEKVYVVGEPSQNLGILGEILDPVVGSWEEIKDIPGFDDGSLMSCVYIK